MTGTEALEPLKQLLKVTDDPTQGSENLCVTAMPDGRMIMYEAGRRNRTFEYEEEMARLSKGREVWFGGYDTCVMASTMALWRNGSEVWAVERIPHVAERYIIVRGTPPPMLDEIKRRAFSNQDDEDRVNSCVDCLIEIPVELWKELHGFDPEEQDMEGDYFELYSADARGFPEDLEEPGFWARLRHRLAGMLPGCHMVATGQVPTAMEPNGLQPGDEADGGGIRRSGSPNA